MAVIDIHSHGKYEPSDGESGGIPLGMTADYTTSTHDFISPVYHVHDFNMTLSPNTCPTFAQKVEHSKLYWKHNFQSAVWNVARALVFLSSCPFTFTSEGLNSVKSVLWLVWNMLCPLNRSVLRRQAGCVDCACGTEA